MDRKTARACAMKLVYEWKMGGDGGEDTLSGLLEISSEDEEFDFVQKLLDGVKANENALGEALTKYLAPGWTLLRLCKVDLSILYIAAYEILYTGLETSIIINEAVELAKKYSGDKDSSFINGLLGSMARSERNA